MAAMIIVILAIILIANLAWLAGFYFLPLYAFNQIMGGLVSTWSPIRPRWWVRLAIAAIIIVAVPLLLNFIRHRERANLVRDDISWSGLQEEVGAIALLTDTLEDKNWHVPGECGPLRCRSLLYQHIARAVLVGSPPPIGKALDPALKLTRYRLEKRAWCPPLENLDGRRHGRDMTELAGLAAGECLVSEPATLADADTIVLHQSFTAPGRTVFYTVHDDITGGRLSLYRRHGEGWQELFRQTKVGGSDWFVPMLIGQLNRDLFGAMMFGGGVIGFATSKVIEADPPDLDAWLKSWNLSGRDGFVPSEADVRLLAWKVLSDPTLPPASAAMQFLATYVWFDGWNGKDRALQAAIIRDLRVTQFPNTPWKQTTPAELAPAIIDRVMATDLAAPDSPSRGWYGNRVAVRILSEVFSLLPSSAAAPFHGELMLLAADRMRRQYVPAMFLRLADAGPPAVAYLETLILTDLAEGRAAPDKKAWATGDGCVVALAMYGLSRLGPDAQSAMPIILTAIADDLAKAYPRDELRSAGYLALLHMGKLDALTRVRPLGVDYSLKAMDRNAPWQIGQCGRFH